MTLNANKQSACGLSGLAWILLCLFWTAESLAQQDTVALKDVEISARKTELSQIGKKTEVLDSTVKDQFKYTSVSDLLSYNSSVFIKNYGPGGLSTTAFRGGNAAQTAVLWNGFNLQNAMLGQSDLALMPVFLFETVAIEYGGSSSLWGSGSIGGSIRLDNKATFNQGLSGSINLGGGSFGALNTSAGVLVSRRRFISSTKLYMNSATNNYKYRDTLDKEHPEKRQKDAEYNLKGLMQEFRFLIRARQVLSVNAWLNTSHRHLPTYDPARESRTYQDDAALRLTANWSYVANAFKSTLRAGYFADRIDYADSVSRNFSNSKARTLMLESENYFNLYKHYQLNIAVNALSSTAESQSYEAVKSLSRASVLAGNRISLLEKKLLAYVSLRAEYFSVGVLPLTGNVSAEYKLFRNFTARLNTARVYRQPTFNELYWVPGGNIHLKPEQGFTYEGELSYQAERKSFMFFVSGSAYSRKIDNWILWVPGANGNPTPENLQKVWSRGTETSWKLNYRKNKLRAGISLITGYVLSTIASSARENDNTPGKQLIYTPRYTVNGNVSLGYANSDLVFYHQYCGYRFVSSDNLSWLPPYHVSSLRLNHTLKLRTMKLVLYAAVNNLFNANYSVLAGRPMPLRAYELGISILAKRSFKNQ